MIPNIVVDADTRNIEELDRRGRPGAVQAAQEPRPSWRGSSGEGAIRFNDYEGMMPEMAEQTLIIDDLNHHEAEILMEKYKPDVFCAGIKEKYVIQKSGVPQTAPQL